MALFLRRFAQRRLALFGLMLFLIVLVLGLAAPLIAPFPSQKTNLRDSLEAPSSRHLLGTDLTGTDIFSEVLWGSRNSLKLALSTVAASILIGGLIGALAGYFGGWLDLLLSRVVDMFLVLPRVLFAMVLVAVLGSSIWNIFIALTIAYSPVVARLVRAEYMSIKSRVFVDAARVIGAGQFTIIFREILPSVVPIILVTSTFLLGQAILNEALLSFIGLNDPNISSWGKMVFVSQANIRFAWWTGVVPGVAIALTVLGLNLAGDGLNEVINPKTARGKIVHKRRPV